MENKYKCPKDHACNWENLTICDKSIFRTNQGYRASLEGGIFFGKCPYSKLIDKIVEIGKQSFNIENILEGKSKK